MILVVIFGQSQTRLIHENQDRLIVTPQMFGVILAMLTEDLAYRNMELAQNCY